MIDMTPQEMAARTVHTPRGKVLVMTASYDALSMYPKVRLELENDGRTYVGYLSGPEATPLKTPRDGATHWIKVGEANVGLGDDAAAGVATYYADALQAMRGYQSRAQERGWEAAEASCPEGLTPMRRKWANGDLMAAEYEARDGVTVMGSDLLESHNGYYWLPASEVKEARADQAQRRERAEAHRQDLQAVEVPAEAVAAYERCGGDPDRLPDDIDNPLYWLVKRYAPAIEEQGLALPPLPPRDELLPEGA